MLRSEQQGDSGSYRRGQRLCPPRPAACRPLRRPGHRSEDHPPHHGFWVLQEEAGFHTLDTCVPSPHSLFGGWGAGRWLLWVHRSHVTHTLERGWRHRTGPCRCPWVGGAEGSHGSLAPTPSRPQTPSLSVSISSFLPAPSMLSLRPFPPHPAPPGATSTTTPAGPHPATPPANWVQVVRLPVYLRSSPPGFLSAGSVPPPSLPDPASPVFLGH